MIDELKAAIADVIRSCQYVDPTIIEEATYDKLADASGAVIGITTDRSLALLLEDAGWGMVGAVGGYVVHTHRVFLKPAGRAPAILGQTAKPKGKRKSPTHG